MQDVLQRVLLEATSVTQKEENALAEGEVDSEEASIKVSAGQTGNSGEQGGWLILPGPYRWE